jgi:proteasome lid subunit RPN8/RPN11
MRIPRHLIEEMIAHAREDAPNECCGMVGGRDGEAATLHRTRNALASPFSYDIDSQDLIRTYNEITGRGDELVAIYHSHTRSAAVPSQTDINLAQYPDSLYVIVTLEDPDEPGVRGWWIRDGTVEEEQIEIA